MTPRMPSRALTVPVLALAIAASACASDPKCPRTPAPEPAAQPAPAAQAAPKPKEFQLEPYAFVILRRGPAWTPEKTEASEALQREHLGHLRHMAEIGKMVVAGPFDDQKDETMRGLCLYRTSLDEARALAESDPAVKAGRLKVEVLTWYTEKGAMMFPIAEALRKK